MNEDSVDLNCDEGSYPGTHSFAVAVLAVVVAYQVVACASFVVLEGVAFSSCSFVVVVAVVEE